MFLSNVELAFVILLLGALCVCAFRSWKAAGWIAAVFVAYATMLAWIEGLSVLLGGRAIYSQIASIPGFRSDLAVFLDPLGAGFLMLITAVSLAATIYSIGYMQHYADERPRRFYSLLLLFIAGMVGVVSVADWLFFIVFWELMTLASYFLVTFERKDPVVARAGFKYFLMTHVATAGLLVAAVVLWGAGNSFSFDIQAHVMGRMSVTLRSLLLAFYLLAFTTKAGIFPMGDWLPDAHPAAPSGVSAILSGVMIKLGAYGFLRVFCEMLPRAGHHTEQVTWGIIAASLGVLSAFAGGVAAMRENDTKRMLALSSISQTGYIFFGLGIAVIFARTAPILSLLGLVGAGFHILNDGIYKSLLFMNAGSAYICAGTRDMNRMGGLSAVIPVSAAAGLIGVFSLAGMPFTNGFASKWILYQAAVSGGIQYTPIIAMAIAIFFVSLCTMAYSLKYFGTVFLGKMSVPASELKRLPGSMKGAQLALAAVCMIIGIFPVFMVSMVARAMGASYSDLFYTGTSSMNSIAMGGAVSASWNPLLLLLVLAVGILIAYFLRKSGGAKVRDVSGWYCGEEHVDDEVRSRARGFYSPLNDMAAKAYPHVPLPRLPALGRMKESLNLDGWLYGPLTELGGDFVDRVKKTHVGTPQLYMIWQVAGMVVVVILLFALMK